MFVNSKETQASQAFLSQLRGILCPGLPLFYIPGGWLRGFVEEMASHTSDLHTQASTLMPTTTSGSGLPPISPPDWHLVVARWPKLHLLMVLPHAGPEASTGCWFFTEVLRLLPGPQPKKLPYRCLSSILRQGSKRNSLGALDRKLGTALHSLRRSDSVAQPKVGTVVILIAVLLPPALRSLLLFSLLEYFYLV